MLFCAQLGAWPGYSGALLTALEGCGMSLEDEPTILPGMHKRWSPIDLVVWSLDRQISHVSSHTQ
jgi:hypothetical protein